MNKKKAIEKAEHWIESRPNELEYREVESVLKGLECVYKGKAANHTTHRWYHSDLEDDYQFKLGILKISLGHKKGSSYKVRTGSVKALITALKLIIQE